MIAAYLVILAAASLELLASQLGHIYSDAWTTAWSAELMGFVLLTLPVVLYFAILESSSGGATLGKRANEHEAVGRQTGPISRYAGIRIPVLLLAGAKSPRSGNGGMGALHREIATSTLAVLGGLDHFAPEERPDTVAGHLSTFFSDAFQEEINKP